MAYNCKYYKQQKQVSWDSGQTWSNVSPAEYQVGDLYQIDSPDCLDPGLIRWVVVPGDYLCDGKDKYVKEIEQYTIDNGIIWLTVYPATYRKGSLIESNSNVCDNKWEGHYADTEGVSHGCGFGYKYVPGVGCVYVDPIKFIRCSTSSSTTLSRTETQYNPYTLINGIIGDCVTEIGDNAFQGYSAMSSLTMLEPDNITSIGDNAFSGCSNLSSFDIPDNVTTIGDYAFSFCGSLTSSIDIPSGVTTIGTGVFNQCTGITSATIGSGVTSIGSSAFYWCTNLTSITLPDSLTTIGNYAFDHCTSLTSIDIPSGVTSIGQQVFQYCTSLSSITIPDGVTSIGMMAFQNCSGLTSIAIPDSVTSIDWYAFSGCSGLTSCTIGSGITSIGRYAFKGCSSPWTMTITATVPPSLGTSVFDNSNITAIYVLAAAVTSYKQASGWSNFSSLIQAIP